MWTEGVQGFDTLPNDLDCEQNWDTTIWLYWAQETSLNSLSIHTLPLHLEQERYALKSHFMCQSDIMLSLVVSWPIHGGPVWKKTRCSRRKVWRVALHASPAWGIMWGDLGSWGSWGDNWLSCWPSWHSNSWTIYTIYIISLVKKLSQSCLFGLRELANRLYRKAALLNLGF